MIHYTKVAGWMGFPHLTVSAGLTYSYTIAYKLKDKTGEVWTTRFTRFKDKKIKAEWGAAYVLYEAVPALMKQLDLNPKRVAFIPALSSGETNANPDRSIPWITKGCARRYGAQYIDNAISKNVHQKIHSIYSADGRSAELDKANYQAKKIDADHVFVFDDIITRGDTLSRIALAILKTNPTCKVYGIALAKAESVAFCPNPDNDQVPARWDELWKHGEQEYDARNRKG
ncbi:hypothetical protein [Shinella zoogloeoides]